MATSLIRGRYVVCRAASRTQVRVIEDEGWLDGESREPFRRSSTRI